MEHIEELIRLKKRAAGSEDVAASSSSVKRDWPTGMLELAWPPKSLKDNYGLHTCLPDWSSACPLGTEMVTFRAWCTDGMNTDRGKQYARPVQNNTFDGTMDCVLGFMGFQLKVGEARGCGPITVSHRVA